MGKLFFSHRLELLAGHLAMEMAQDGYPPLVPRIILVPSSSMKQWLLLQCAEWNEAKGIAGCKIHTLREGLESFLPASSGFTEIYSAVYTSLSDCSDPFLTEYLEKNSLRRIELAYQLALLFIRYGELGRMPFFESAPDHWQRELFQKLFIEGTLRLPMQLLTTPAAVIQSPIHCFGFDFLPQSIWQFLASLPSASAYLFSPCSYYWEDVCSDRERKKLGRYWRQKGASIEKQAELDSYLREAPPLLANWGRLGRETLKILDPFDWEIVEDYRDFGKAKNSNLGRLQKRLLEFAPKEEQAWPQDSSISLTLVGSSRFKEIEHLRRSILHLMEQEQLLSSEIAVLAPDIQEYAPLVECLFSDLPYRISGVEMRSKSFFYQGMMRLFDLVAEDWEAEDLLSLFENPSFAQARKWDVETLENFREWLSHQKRGDILEECLLHRLVYLFPDGNSQVPVGSAEQIEQWIAAIRSLRVDLSLLRVTRHLTDWAFILQQLVEKYLFIDLSEESDAAASNFFQRSLKELIEAQDKESLFPFALIRKLLQRPVSGGQIHASHLHAIRFASLEEGAMFPVRALFLIGMDEESYPRRSQATSLDLLRQADYYLPNPADRDRYLLLQALFTGREFLQISYRHLTSDEGKPVQPTFLVEELRRSLDLPIPEEIAGDPTTPSQSFSFPWPEKPIEALPEGEFTIPLSDLVSLSRHPWKFYLQKKWGIYLEDRKEESFSLQRALALRASLQKPIGDILKEELAPGICGEALKMELLKAAEEWEGRMETWGTALESLAFRRVCQMKKQTEKGWEFPPIELSLGERLHVKIIGEVKTCSSQGYLHAGDDSMEGLLKVWPECLAASIALDRKEIHFLKNGKIKTIEKPEAALKSFLAYYFLALSAPSPLLSEWAAPILRKGADEWEKKIRDRIAGKGVRFEDPVFDWVLARVEMPSAELWWQHWGQPLNDHFSGLLSLYPMRGGYASI